MMLNLGKWWVIARREWQVAFQAPLAWVLLALWMFMGGRFFVGSLLGSQSTDLTPVFWNLAVLLIFIAPLLTMRLLAEERRNGSDELVLTAPVSTGQWVLGKYVGVLFVWTMFAIVSLLFPLATSRFGAVQWGVVASSWIGMWLFGAATLAMGLFASALTSNQVVAAMVSFAVVLLFYGSTWVPGHGWVGTLMNYISLPSQFNNFTLGLVSVSHLIYMVSLCVGFLFLAVRVVDLRRWT